MGGILQPVHRNLSGIRIPPPWQQESQLGIPVANQALEAVWASWIGCRGASPSLRGPRRSPPAKRDLVGGKRFWQGDYNKFFQRGPLGSTILRESSFPKAQTPASNPTARRGHFLDRFLAVFLKENTPPKKNSALRGQLSRRGACGAAARRRLL